MKCLMVMIAVMTHFVSANPFQSLNDFKSVQLSDNLFVVKSNRSNTNIGIFVGDKSVVLIDPVVGNSNNLALVNAIKKLTDKPIQYVINTHAHIDHSGANAFYRALGATIVLHKTDTVESEILSENEIAFKKSYSIDMGNEKIDLFHIASHSSDDVIIYFKLNNAIFVGDTYMHNLYPHAYVGGSKGLFKVIEKTTSLSDDKTHIVTAHGRFVTSKKEFLDFKSHATSWYTRIDQLSKNGLSVNDIAQDEELIRISKIFRPLSVKHLKERIVKTLKAESDILKGNL